MIQSFADSETKKFFETGRSRRFPPDIRKRSTMRLIQLNAATVLEDVRIPPSNRLEALTGKRKGQWSIRINEQWRICFIWKDGDAYEVEIIDYH
jgi:proteic killer suppression protein